ncbi:ribulose-phosphate 3-epimerase [Stomatobaculum longum]|uniref:ribulose-phosphate 3-epimerase n=1 Tax=Stomatobaculum longum TaxID=796942 RepID=UPI0028DB26D5|nr:ribulose-phosphate 3-epimerase [Stomatobaculum longum]
MKTYRLAPSLLSADFTELGSQIDLLKALGVRALHCDIMDGDFVPSISFGMPVLKSIRKRTDLYLDAHLMVTEPDRYIDAFVEAGADGITVHAEACRHLDRTVQHIKACGKKAAVALNPATPLVAVEDILPELDMVLIMSVNPGFGGQSYIPYCTDKIRRLRALADQKQPELSIQVDGGVNRKTLAEVLAAGADDIVAGSAVFGGNIAENVAFFRDAFRQAEAKEKA